MSRRAILYALASAALFGVSTPAAKVLVGSIHPGVLAGLLYCGAGIGVGILRRMFPSALATGGAPESRLGRQDILWLAMAILFGGGLGPVVMMLGLARTE